MWEDILEALTLGGAGAIGGYRQAKELEEARAERERERMQNQQYRDRMLDFEQQQIEIARQREERAAGEARASRRLQAAAQGFVPATSEEIYGRQFAPDAPSISELQVDMAPSAIRSPEIAPPSIRTAPGTMVGTGARVAPGDTNAVRQALELASRETPKDTARMTRRETAAPEPVRGPGAREMRRDFVDLGDGEMYMSRGEGVFAPTPEEIARSEARARADVELGLQRGISDIEAQRIDDIYNDAIALGFTPQEAFAIANRYSMPSGREEPDPASQLRSNITSRIDTFMRTTGAYPTQSMIMDFAVGEAAVLGITPDELAGIMGTPGAGGGGGEEPAQQPTDTDRILSGITSRRERAQSEAGRERELSMRLSELKTALSTGVYRGVPMDERAYREVEREAFSLEIAGVAPAEMR